VVTSDQGTFTPVEGKGESIVEQVYLLDASTPTLRTLAEPRKFPLAA